jgi:hypothetical protein
MSWVLFSLIYKHLFVYKFGFLTNEVLYLYVESVKSFDDLQI